MRLKQQAGYLAGFVLSVSLYDCRFARLESFLGPNASRCSLRLYSAGCRKRNGRWSPRAWPARGPLCRDVPGQILVVPRSDDSGNRLVGRCPALAGLHRAFVPGVKVDSGGLRHHRLLICRSRFSQRRTRRIVGTQTGHDDTHQPGDSCLLRRVARGHIWPVRSGGLVGGRHAHHGHDSRSLVGDATALSGIMRLVSAAQASGSRAQALADRAAALLFYVALIAGATTFIYWWLAGDKGHGLIRAATVLIIACPHALGLAIPLVIAISTSLGAQNGLLVKDRLPLERARHLDLMLFGKTGTRTI